MNRYTEWPEYLLDDLHKECSQRGIQHANTKRYVIEKFLASDRSRMEQEQDRRAYNNLTDPLGEKRFAQAKAEMDWNMHEAKCKGKIEIEFSSNLARNSEYLREIFEAEARKKEAALQAKLTAISKCFNAKMYAIMMDLQKLAKQQLSPALATAGVQADEASEERMAAGGASGIEVSTSAEINVRYNNSFQSP
jgi:hypothetical protein